MCSSLYRRGATFDAESAIAPAIGSIPTIASTVTASSVTNAMRPTATAQTPTAIHEEILIPSLSTTMPNPRA